MEETKYVRVSEAITSAILESANVRPIFLHRNPDNTITAVFDEEPEAHVREQIKEANEAIVLLDPLSFEERQSYDLTGMPATIRFGFAYEPTDYS